MFTGRLQDHADAPRAVLEPGGGPGRGPFGGVARPSPDWFQAVFGALWTLASRRPARSGDGTGSENAALSLYVFDRSTPSSATLRSAKAHSTDSFVAVNSLTLAGSLRISAAAGAPCSRKSRDRPRLDQTLPPAIGVRAAGGRGQTRPGPGPDRALRPGRVMNFAENAVPCTSPDFLTGGYSLADDPIFAASPSFLPI